MPGMETDPRVGMVLIKMQLRTLGRLSGGAFPSIGLHQKRTVGRITAKLQSYGEPRLFPTRTNIPVTRTSN